jgi:beta-phosphoglucomutase
VSATGTSIRGVIFDLDGVLVSTDDLHFRAWKELAEREGIPFTRQDNERLRGVDRMASLEILLERATRTYSQAEKLALAGSKNDRYRLLLAELGPSNVLPGARELLAGLRERGVRTAVGSSSRNAREILHRLALDALLDVIVDGTDITRSKPDPEVFALAASRMGLSPAECLVVEDAASGVEAALRGGFRVLGIGDPVRLPGVPDGRCVPGLASISIAALLSID